MKRSHLFIMDSFEKLNIKLDTSLSLALSLTKKKETTYFCEIQDLLITSSQNGPECLAAKMTFASKEKKPLIGEKNRVFMNEFDSIHMRKDPPFDSNYIQALWILQQTTTDVINSVYSLLTLNEKLLTLSFPGICKEGMVSSDSKVLYDYMKTKCNGHGIFKPLNLFGGKGIFDLNDEGIKTTKKIAEKTNKSQYILQAFDKRVYEGEVRVVTWNGEAVTWCLKIPKEGNYLANTSAGAKLTNYIPKNSLKEKVEHIAKKLTKKGVVLTGMDIIGEEITEINITSPRLLLAEEYNHELFFDKISSQLLNNLTRK